MMTDLIALALGITAGLIGLLPGLHPSVLLVGLLPFLGFGGDAGAIALAGAIGSGTAVAALAKTFHPASPESLRSATPEQVLAYRGDGLKAVHHMLSGSWIGLVTSLMLVTPLMLLGDQHTFTWLYSHVFKPVVPFIVLAFLTWTVWTAKKKLATLLTILAAGLLGFLTFHSPALQDAESLGPLLGGLFSVPTLLLVLNHKGKPLSFPKQRQTPKPFPNKLATLGGLMGMLTAACAGLGASAAVSSLAGKVKESTYLSMQAASESANALFALALLVLAGVARSGPAAVMLREHIQLDPTLGGLLLLGVLGGLTIGSSTVWLISHHYVKFVSKTDPRNSAILILITTIIFSCWHCGLPGLLLLTTAGCLGIAAKLFYAPNQALVAVLSVPSVIYALGLAGPLAGMLALK